MWLALGAAPRDHPWLAGMAAVLATPTAADILDNPAYDAALLAIWTFIAGGIYGSVGYFVIGFGVYFGAGCSEPRTSDARGRRSASLSFRSQPRFS